MDHEHRSSFCSSLWAPCCSLIHTDHSSLTNTHHSEDATTQQHIAYHSAVALVPLGIKIVKVVFWVFFFCCMFCQYVWNLNIFVTFQFNFNDLLFQKVKWSQQRKTNVTKAWTISFLFCFLSNYLICNALLLQINFIHTCRSVCAQNFHM